MSEIIIRTTDLARNFVSYEKTEGFMGSITGFWNRKHTVKVALQPTNLELEKGQIIGLVGANGAGKTTLLKILSGLIHPTSGSAEVLGFKPWERNFAYLRRMSILLGQKNQLWWDLSPQDSYRLLGEIYLVEPAVVKKRVSELSEVLDCKSILATQLRRLSLGERMKAEIIGALLHRPDVIFLDEPTIGLDIIAQKSIREFLSSYVKEYKPTVILTSHYMDDITRLADKLLLISKGKIVYGGTVKDFVMRAEQESKIIFQLAEPLERDTLIRGGLALQKGQQSFEVKSRASEIHEVLPQITNLPGILSLRIEEVDFEDVIHRFLAKESGVLQAGNPAEP